MKLIPLIALAATLGLSGCGLLPVRTVYVCPDIPEISRPIVPTLTRDAMDTVDQPIWDVLSTRERLIVGYSLELEAAIQAIRADCE